MSVERFIEAQKNSYDTALMEIRTGRKKSHWIWYIFPQIQGLGFSSTARYYAIKDREEAEAYMAHSVLRQRLIEISEALLELESDDAREVMGYPDDLKLKSSMTLFAEISEEPVFSRVLNKFFQGEVDERTLQILEEK